MFDFLHEWDIPLEEYERDMESSIKGEVRSWLIHAQSYCERLIKVYNNKEMYFSIYDRMALGDFLADNMFVRDFQEKTGFGDIAKLKKLNSIANDAKHNVNVKVQSDEQVAEWIKFIHTLSIKTYNYVEDTNLEEKFDSQHMNNLLKNKEEEVEQFIEYADEIVIKKNEIIASLQNDLDVMNAFANEDRKKIEKYEKYYEIHKADRINYEKFLNGIRKAFSIYNNESMEPVDFIKLLNEIFEKRRDYSSWRELIKKSFEEHHSKDYDQDHIIHSAYDFSKEITSIEYNGSLEPDDLTSSDYEYMFSGPEFID